MEQDVLNRVTKQIGDRNVKEALDDLTKLHNCFCCIVNLLHEKQIKLPHERYEFYETMAIKFRLNVYSIIELYTVDDYVTNNIIYHDLSSIYLLNRSLLETYLTFFYSYVLPGSEEESLMNYYIFKISGLVHRQTYGIDDPQPPSPELTRKRDGEKQLIANYQGRLQNLPFFNDLTISQVQKNNLLAGKYAKRFSFIELIKMSDLKNILFVDMWKLYSNYAHCELLGLLQIISYADTPRNINNALYGTLNNTLIIVSVMLTDFIAIFKDTSAENVDIPELDEETMTLLEFWYNMGTESKAIN